MSVHLACILRLRGIPIGVWSEAITFVKNAASRSELTKYKEWRSRKTFSKSLTRPASKLCALPLPS